MRLCWLTQDVIDLKIHKDDLQTLGKVPPHLSSPKESLEVLRKFCPASIARVHGDEESHGGYQTDLHPLK